MTSLRCLMRRVDAVLNIRVHMCRASQRILLIVHCAVQLGATVSELAGDRAAGGCWLVVPWTNGGHWLSWTIRDDFTLNAVRIDS